MSLLVNPLISEHGVCSAVWTPSKLVLGLSHGVLRVYSHQDCVLEREVRLGKGPLSALTNVPHTEVIAVICDKICTVHDLSTRKLVKQVDTASAKYLASLPGVLVVGSAYKLRILSFVGSRYGSIAVVDTVDRQKVRAVGTVPQLTAEKASERSEVGCIYTIIGTKVPKLWRIDRQNAPRLVPVMVMDPQVFSRAHKFVIGGVNSHLLVGSSAGSRYVHTANPVRIVKEMETVTGVCAIKSQPEGVPLLVTMGTPSSTSASLKLLSPFTASVLSEPDSSLITTDAQLVGPNLVTSNQQLLEISAELRSEMLISSMISPEEAAKLAFAWPAHSLTPEIRDLQHMEITKLFNESLIDEAMQHLLLLEEQEPEEGPFVLNEFASSLLLPYLKELPLDEPSSAAQSLVSTRTSATRDAAKVRYHPLNSAVKYLTYTRRKLKLRNVTNKVQLAGVDTALFLCYLVMRSPLLTSLLRAPNFCDPDVVVPRLREQSRWRELVAYLRSCRMHQLALDLLIEYHEPPEVLASYLRSVEDLELVFKYAEKILPANMALVDSVFYDRMPTPNSGAQIYRFLTKLDRSVADEFALHAVQTNGDTNAELHDRVAEILAESEDLERLQEFLRTSPHITVSRLVRSDKIPPAGRAILYERLGDYRQAIDVYLMLDMSKVAQDLAVAHGEASYIFEKLVNSADPSDLADFLNTISPNSDLQLEAVLSRLKSDFSLASIAPFLTTFSAAVVAQTQRANCQEAVSRQALAETSIALANERRQKHTVESLDACAICHKRLGRAITVITNGEAMHHTCARNRNVQNI